MVFKGVERFTSSSTPLQVDTCSYRNHIFKLADLRGRVQAFQVWKHDFDLWVGGDGLKMYQQLEGGFGSMRAILTMWGLGAKKGQKLKSLPYKQGAFIIHDNDVTLSLT